MNVRPLDNKTREIIVASQRNEITEHIIYEKLSRLIKNPHNKEILQRLSNDELKHYNFWKEYTHEDVEPYKLKIWRYLLISRFLGITFGIRLMEMEEEGVQVTYEKLSQSVPDLEAIIKDEGEHEKILIDLLQEERLKYIGSVVLGLNDALVELTGALAGFTFAFQNARLVAMAGLITGVAASLSMAASEYLSIKSEERDQSPLKAAAYTGSAYILTVMFLIFPYLVFTNVYLSLGITILNALVVIFLFTLYISIARSISFRKRFLEMAVISLGIAAISFGIGSLIRVFLHIEM